MKRSGWKSIRLVLLSTISLCLLAPMMLVAAGASQITDGQKAKIKGTIISRSGNLVKVQDKSTGSVDVVKIVDNTKVARDKSFFRRTDMDVTALVPGLTIEAEGVGNAEGQLEAKKVKFNPDTFSVTVAQEKQIVDNQAATSQAQTTANQGVATAQAAGAAAAANAAAVQVVNKRVSDLDDYTTVNQAEVYFSPNTARLNNAGKAALDDLASATLGVAGFKIEIAGYASSTGSANYNQRLSEQRAAAVVQYLSEKDNVPMWRIVLPAGYGETHPAASNADSKGRALNRRVEVKVLVNQGSQSDSSSQSLGSEAKLQH